MARVFLDANYFIGLVNKTPETDSNILDKHEGFVSVLSCHILFYVNKIKVPNAEIKSYIDEFNLINLDSDIIEKALRSPTDDLEDNIQLHSAVKEDCEYFLTSDKKLLKLDFFGKTKLVSSLTSN